MRAAVLYRTNSQSRVFEEAMRRAGLAYNIVGGFSFYERMEVRDIIAYLKLALNPNDSIALQRVINSPPRGIGKQTVDELARRANDYGLSLWETIALVIEKPENLSMRAVTALRGFRRIILRLGEMAGVSRKSNVQWSQSANTATPQHPYTAPDRLPFPTSSKQPSSKPVTSTRSRARRLTKPKRVWKTCRNWSTPPSITTNKASKGCESSSITRLWFPIRTSTNATRR